jgi:hypothetical protein
MSDDVEMRMYVHCGDWSYVIREDRDGLGMVRVATEADGKEECGVDILQRDVERVAAEMVRVARFLKGEDSDG